MNQVVALDTPRRSLIASMADRYGMEPKNFEATVRATVMPANTSNEEFAAFLLVANEYGLNPITKEIFAFPKKGGGIQPVVSVDGWCNLINSNPQCDGVEFEDVHDDKGNVSAITCRIYRKDRKHPTAATEYLAECKRGTDTWTTWPRRMLRHKALIQAARYAFGFAGIVDPDEAERGETHYSAAPGTRLIPPSPPKAPEQASAPASGPLPSEWTDYLARQLEELNANDTAHAKQGVHDAVSDAIGGARERGELSETESKTILAVWEKMSA
jgi:phage recombination protein Bet